MPLILKKGNTSPRPPKDTDRERIIRIRTEKDFDQIIESRDDTVVIIESGVRRIPEYALSEMDTLRQVIIPDTVECIENGAFVCCSGLRELRIPDSVRYIGERAFESCSSLERVVLPYGLKEIAFGTFTCCISLKEVWLPPTVKVIEDEAFLACRSLETIRGGEGLRYVNCNAFFDCPRLRELSLPETVSSVGVQGFEETRYQPPVTLFSMESPRMEAEDTVTIPDGVRTILAGSLCREPKLRRVILPDSVRNISRHAFDSSDIIQAEEDEVHALSVKRFPAVMNLPKGYLRQETQFDAKLALALCDTVWKDEVTASDYECIILYQNDPLARYLAAQRLSAAPWIDLKSMMARPRRSILHLEHLTEYFCMYYPLLRSFEKDTETIREQLYREALARGASDALRLLYRLSRPLDDEDATLAELMLYRSMSPCEAELLLGYYSSRRNSPEAFIGETQLEWKDGVRTVPSDYLRCLAALWAKADILQIMAPYSDSRPFAEQMATVDTAASALDYDSLIKVLNRNSAESDIMLGLLCHFADARELEELYRDYTTSRFDEAYTRRYHMRKLRDALRFSGTDVADMLIAKLDDALTEAGIRSREKNFRSPAPRLDPYDDTDESDDSGEFNLDEMLFGKRRGNNSGDGWGDLFSTSSSDPIDSFDAFEDEPDRYDDFFGEHDEDHYGDCLADADEDFDEDFDDDLAEYDEAEAYAASAEDFGDDLYDEAEAYAASAEDFDDVLYDEAEAYAASAEDFDD